MNKAKWNSSRISISTLAAKFAEEAGEVAGAIADREAALISAPLGKAVEYTNHYRPMIMEEISHARFLLDLIEERVKKV